MIALATSQLWGGDPKSMVPVYVTILIGILLVVGVVVVALRSIGIGTRMR